MWRYIYTHTYMICTSCTHITLEEKNDINFIFVFHFLRFYFDIYYKIIFSSLLFLTQYSTFRYLHSL